MTERFPLTTGQDKALLELRAALLKCQRAKLLVIDCNGTLYALNGKCIEAVLTAADSKRADAHEIEDEMTWAYAGSAWHGSYSDDRLSAVLTESGRALLGKDGV